MLVREGGVYAVVRIPDEERSVVAVASTRNKACTVLLQWVAVVLLVASPGARLMRFARMFVPIVLGCGGCGAGRAATTMRSVEPTVLQLAEEPAVVELAEHAPLEAASSDEPWPPVPAMQALMRGRTVVLAEPDRRVAAIDAVTGEVRWRTEPSTEAGSMTLLAWLANDRVVVRTGDTLTVLDATSGSVLARASLPPEVAGETVSVEQREGACAIRSECVFAPIDCERAQPLGRPFRVERATFARAGESPTSGCVLAGHAIGRADDLALYLVSSFATADHSALRRGDDVVVARDVHTGRDRYRVFGPVGRSSEVEGASGVAPDGTTCWATWVDGELAPLLRAFRCASGARLFEHRLDSSAREIVLTAWVRGADGRSGLFVADWYGASLLDPRSGRARWRTAIPGPVLSLPEAGRIAPTVRPGTAFPVAVWLDVEQGVEVRRETLSERVVLARAPDDRVRILREDHPLDSSGALVPPSDDDLAFRIEREDQQMSLRMGSEPPLVLPEGAWVLGEHHEGTDVRLVYFVPAADGVGHARSLHARRASP